MKTQQGFVLIEKLVGDAYPDLACPERRGDAHGMVFVACDTTGTLCVWSHWNTSALRLFHDAYHLCMHYGLVVA